MHQQLMMEYSDDVDRRSMGLYGLQEMMKGGNGIIDSNHHNNIKGKLIGLSNINYNENTYDRSNNEIYESGIDRRIVTSSFVKELPEIVSNSRVRSKNKISNASTRYATPFNENLLRNPIESNNQVMPNSSVDYTVHINNNLKTETNIENNKDKSISKTNDKKSM